MKNWDKKAIETLKLENNLSDKKSSVIIPKSNPKGLNFIINHLIASGIEYQEELQFLHNRKFRFDVAIWKPIKIAVEYEGLAFKDPVGKSGHTTLLGYSNNCTKYNEAQIEGWIILRYTAMNYHNFPTDLHRLINKP